MPLKLGSQDVTLKLGSQDVTAYLGAESVSAFDPASIEGLVGWYDSADLASMAQGSDGSGAVAAGDPVGYWADKSGAGNHVTQATPANRPTATASAVNGKTALVFDGSNDSLSRTGYTSQTSLSGLTRIMVVSSSQVSMATRTLTSGLAEAGGGQCFFTTGSSPTVIRCSINTYHLDVARQGDTIPLRVYESVYDGAAGTMKTFYSGTEVASGAGAPATTSATAGPILWIGSNVGINNFINGPIAEYLIYDRAISTAERQKIEGYLAWKWGLQSQLPYDHPYAASFPGLGFQATPTDADTLTYLAAVKAADGTGVEVGVANAVDAFVTGCKADGIWDAIQASCILAGARTLAGALVPLVGTAPTNNNFVSGDYDRETGLVGNGTSKYLDTNRAANADPQDNFHISLYFSEAFTAANISMGAGGAASGATQIQGAQYRCRNGTGDNMASVGGSISGFAGMARDNSATFIGRDIGTTTTYTRASQSPVTVNLLTHARNSSTGTPGLFSAMRIGFYSIGESLDLELLEARVNTLVADIGNAI